MSPPPLRVLHVLSTFGTGGTEQGIINLANHADPARVQVGVTSFVPSGDEESRARIRAEGFSYHPLGKSFGNDPRVAWRLRRTIRKGRYDIVHSHGWPTFLETRFAVLGMRRIKVIHGEHGTSFLEARRRRTAYSLLKGGFDCFLFVSERLRREFEEKTRFPPAKMRVIPNGVDFDRFDPEGPTLREDPAFEAGWLHVGTSGRFHPVKGHRQLLELADRLKREDLRVRLHFAGDGGLRREYEAFIRDRGLERHVHLHGRLRRIEDFYRTLDLFVLSSRSEGHPNAVLESVAAGCPVAATPVGDLPDFIRPGQNGFLFDHDDVDALLDVVRQRLQDPGRFEEIRREALRDARERFSIRRMVDDYVRTYEAITGRAHPDSTSAPPPATPQQSLPI